MLHQHTVAVPELRTDKATEIDMNEEETHRPENWAEFTEHNQSIATAEFNLPKPAKQVKQNSRPAVSRKLTS